jgi:hypothetical protein
MPRPSSAGRGRGAPRVRRPHHGISVRYNFVVSTHARCTNCGTAKVQRVAKRDLLDGLSKNVASQLQRLTFAPLNRCAACRLQFYDWRTVAPPQVSSARVQPRPQG